nr:hypothetical protein [Serratia marcescens]
MSHPSDGEAWKHFDRIHPNFASEPRNVRLGLCSDGFSPFGMHGRAYSIWPVIVTPYNLPPWMCMKTQYMFVSLIIPGPRTPKKNIDIYLQPLIDELQYLWETGVTTYDVAKKQNFTMRAALMWTINDFPAYGMLSGWSTHGRMACPICMDKTNAFQLKHGRKTSHFNCHRKFLPVGHTFRKSKTDFYKDRIVKDIPPSRLAGTVINEWVFTAIESPSDDKMSGFQVDHQ